MSHAARSLRISGSICVIVGALSVLIMSAGAAGQSYALVDLTEAADGVWGIANDVNDDAVVVGRNVFCAVRWERIAGKWSQEGLQAELCEPPLATTDAHAFNDSGVAVGGLWQFNFPSFPVIWQGQEYEIPGLPFGVFNDVNSSGQVVGGADVWGGPPALIWEDGEVTFLGSGGVTALGINDLGQVVGIIGDKPAQTTASLWENTDGQWEVTALGTLGGSRSGATDINEGAQIVGVAATPDGLFRAFLWEEGVMLNLGTLGGSESFAYAINNLGYVVGTALTAEEEERAFVWQDGVMTDLNDLIVSETDLVLTEANAINDHGAIVGRADTPGGGGHAFMARPLRTGDINLDAFVDAADLALLLGSWGPCPDCANCPADLDNDCTVGPLDLAILLGNWG